jgi:hypothetical protein
MGPHHQHRNNNHLKKQQQHQRYEQQQTFSFQKSSADNKTTTTNDEQLLPTRLMLGDVDTTLMNHRRHPQSRNDNSSDEFRLHSSSKSKSYSYSEGGDDVDDIDAEWPTNTEGYSSSSCCWQSFVHHNRLQDKTTDPDALRWDKAVESFRWGVRQVRKGHRLHGALAICTSILLDTRAYKACRRLPPPPTSTSLQNNGDGKNVEILSTADCLLDDNVAQALLQHQKDHVIIQLCASMIVAMRTEQWKGCGSSSSSSRKHTTTPFSQQQQILRMIETTKNILAQRPKILEIVDNNGKYDNDACCCWSLEHWHYWWAMRYLAVDRNAYWNKALNELNQAIKLNPNHVRARYQAALLYSQYEQYARNKSTAAYKKWKNYVEVAHVDDYCLHDAYTWLAYLVLEANQHKNHNDGDENSIIINDRSFGSCSSSSSSSSISDIEDSRDDQDAAGTSTTPVDNDDDSALFAKASDYLQASDEALRRHVNLYDFITAATIPDSFAQDNSHHYTLWYSSSHYAHDHDTTAATIMKQKAQAVARLRWHPDQRPWIKYWTDDAPSLHLPL